MIDYQALKAKVSRGRVGSDLALIGAADADYVLAQFVLGEDAVQELVRGVDPVTDDRTVLDFTIPRYIGSAFGFGALRERARQGGRNPLGVAIERHRYYEAQQSSIAPYLTNLGDEDVASIEARIALRRSTPSVVTRVGGEAEWHRW